MATSEEQKQWRVVSAVASKVAAALVLGVWSFLLGVAPAMFADRWRPATSRASSHDRLRDRRSHRHAVAGRGPAPLMLCFGGGVLIFTTLMHLVPESRHAIVGLQREGRLPGGVEYLAEMFVCAGFFVTCLLEETLARHRRRSETRDGGRTDAERRQRDVNAAGSAVGDRDCDGDSDDGAAEGDHRSAPDGDGRSLGWLFTLVAVSVHEVFEGLALGLERRPAGVWYLFVAVAAHKSVIAFCVGLELARSKTARTALVACAAAFAAVTPAGLALGMAVEHAGGAADESPGVASAVLQALAAGTLLNVVFLEVLPKHKKPGWSHPLAVILGFGVMMAVQTSIHNHNNEYTDHNHGHAQYQAKEN